MMFGVKNKKKKLPASLTADIVNFTRSVINHKPVMTYSG